MSDLLEKDLFRNLKIQRNNWYYSYKIMKVRKEIKKYLKKNQKEAKCLDIGSGNGIISFGIGNKINQTTLNWKLVDSNYSKDDLEKDERKSIKIKKNEKFDIIIACDVLEHVEYENDLLNLIYESMFKDSILIMTVPAMNALWSYHDVFLKHYRRYNIKQFKKSVNNIFKIENIEYTYKSVFPIALLIRIIQRILKSNIKKHNKGDSSNTSWLANKLFLLILKFEEFISSKIKFINYLPGVSLISSLKKI